MQPRLSHLCIGAILALVAQSGCGSDTEANNDVAAGAGGGSSSTVGVGGSGGSGGAPARPLDEALAIAVDASRDGKADLTDATDARATREAWDTTRGASFIANLDDDDVDGIRDADDTIVNGAEDERDLAPIAIAAIPSAPSGSVGTITMSDLAKENVRVFKRGQSGEYTLIAGTMDACTTDDSVCSSFTATATFTDAEVRAGVTLAIEARSFRKSLSPSQWDGYVDLSYSVQSGGSALEDSTGATEATTTLRVSPWVLFGNLSPFDTVWSSNISPPLVAGLSAATTEAGVKYKKITNWSDDQWTQDFFQTGWTAMVGADGGVQGMRVGNARPWGRRDGAKYRPITWLRKSFLGPDRAIATFYKNPDTGDTYDSHGNHDLLPAYEHGADKYPLGRIIHGSGVLPETRAFYKAQEVQGPPLMVDTSWLLVGHVDEYLSYAPAKTALGWKLLIASPRVARDLLTKAQTDGHGSAVLFEGKQRFKDAESWDMISAAQTIDQVLRDSRLMQASQQAQVEIDANVEILRDAIGLTDDDIIEIPTLFEDTSYGLVAYTPGMVNLLAFGDYAVPPDPFGPVVDGVDILKEDLIARLGSPDSQLGSDGQGLLVRPTDDWDDYHILDGEVHCGSNTDASSPFSSVRWWETGR